MSAVAQIADARTVVPELHVVEATAPTVAELQAKEMNRWMLWFGTPMVVMAIFMGTIFATGEMWGLAGVLGALIADICILIWLCMSSDTNGAGAPELAAAH
jgi:hypothetical protein